MAYNCPNCGKQIEQNILVQSIGQVLCDRCGEIAYIEIFSDRSQLEEIDEPAQRRNVLEALEKIRECVDHFFKHMASNIKKDDLRRQIEYEESVYETYCELLRRSQAEIDKLKAIEEEDSAFISSAELCLESYETEKNSWRENRIRFLKQLKRPGQYHSLKDDEKRLFITIKDHYENLGLHWKRAKEFLDWAHKDLDQ